MESHPQHALLQHVSAAELSQRGRDYFFHEHDPVQRRDHAALVLGRDAVLEDLDALHF